LLAGSSLTGVPSRLWPPCAKPRTAPVEGLHAESTQLVTMDADDVSIAYHRVEPASGDAAGMGKRTREECSSAGTDHPAEVFH
jgi:hypothetical protein